MICVSPAATFSFKFRLAVVPPDSVTFSNFASANPCFSAVMVYFPAIGSPAIEKLPEESVSTVRASPLSALVAVTCTPGTEA